LQGHALCGGFWETTLRFAKYNSLETNNYSHHSKSRDGAIILFARAFLAHSAYCFPKLPAQRVPLQKLYYREEGRIEIFCLSSELYAKKAGL